jgi:SWI/SNF related-matrix-associated actin-dependent regulator of chromatin subfamily C
MSSQARNAGPFQKAFKEFEQPWFFEQLEPVRKSLEDSGFLNHAQAVLNNPKVLALLTAGVLQLQQNVLGRHSLPANRKMAVLPESLFRDFEPKGSLFSILSESIKHLARMNVAVHTFVKFVQQESHEAQCASHMDLLLNIKFELEQRSLLPQYRIHFTRTISSKAVSALSAIIKAHGGEVVSSQLTCTHQIVPHPFDDAAPLGEAASEVQRSHFFRTLQQKDGHAYTHWSHYPSSYREWLPVSEIKSKIEEPRSIPARWNVSSRFIYDLDIFNEWMDEADYEPEQFEEEPESAEDVAESARKRKGDGEAPESKKAKVSELEQSPPRQLSFADAHKAVGVERVSAPSNGCEFVVGSGAVGLAQANVTTAPADMQAKPSTAGSTVGDKVDAPVFADATQPNSEGSTYATPSHVQHAADRIEPVVVPSYSSWFSFGAVSEVERKQLPDFFESKSPLRNEATYVMIRDFIVKLYRQRPRSHLSVTECRRHIAIDAGAIFRIHAFLDHWGLINYDIQPDARPVLLGLSGTGQPVLLHGPYGQQFLQTDGLHGTSTSSYLRLSGMNTASAPTAGNIASRISVLTSDSSNDVRNDWNPEETLRLLKAIEEYGRDSWIRVAEAVGTKSAAQCVMQFVRFGVYSNLLTFCNLICFHRLPIEDPFLDDSLPGSSAQLGIPPVFGLSDASLDQNGTAFNQFLTRLLEIGKDQDDLAIGAKSGTDVAETVHGSPSEPAAAALAIAQIAARSKFLAACEEQKFNQYANEALLLQLNRLGKRIEDLQNVESVAGALGKVHLFKLV